MFHSSSCRCYNVLVRMETACSLSHWMFMKFVIMTDMGAGLPQKQKLVAANPPSLLSPLYILCSRPRFHLQIFGSSGETGKKRFRGMWLGVS